MVDNRTSGEAGALPRRPVDGAAYERRSREGPCFVCETLAGNPDYREQVTGDFGMQEYLSLQCLVSQVGEALRRELPTERLHIMSLGSQSGNRHVHWHVAPLPPGVPYEQQQFAAFSWEHGVLDLPELELAALARRIGTHIQ
ncbi:MAG TPA: HIT family protein [Actinomycetota bacterium]|jgi:ATP adenylyltransferase|nr:HIT family protein [Actinomycetota bacterium]